MTPLGRPAPEIGLRRLALTPQAIDVTIALTQVPRGIRLAHLADVLSSPVSSAQAGLRALMANRLAARGSTTPPLYFLTAHPARAALETFALVLPEPAHVLAIVLRASPAVAYAAADHAGFIAGLDPDAGPSARGRLDAALAVIAAARTETPPVTMLPREELIRLKPVTIGLRERIDAAVTIKGTLAAPAVRSRRRQVPDAAAETPLA
jgi:hypothetical protein